jgi:hypothetical protein
MMKILRWILFVVILTSGIAIPCRAGYKDWSRRGPEFRILEPLLLNARDVKYVGPLSLDLYAVRVEALRFEVISNIEVQIDESPVSTGSTWGRATAKYELIVGNDVAFKIHDKMLEEIRRYWSSKDLDYLRNYRTLPAEKSLFYKDDAYVLYESCINSSTEQYDTLWLDGKVVRGRFMGFIKGAGFGGQQNFMQEVLRYRVKGRIIKSDYKSDFPPKKFLDLYERGAFKHR